MDGNDIVGVGCQGIFYGVVLFVVIGYDNMIDREVVGVGQFVLVFYFFLWQGEQELCLGENVVEVFNGVEQYRFVQ